MSDTKPILAVTMGDPAGIGPEICLDLLQKDSILSECKPIIFGDYNCLKQTASLLSRPIKANVLSYSDSLTKADYSQEGAYILDLANVGLSEWELGKVNAMTGLASFEYIEKAIQSALEGRVDGIVTAPIHKGALNLAGIDYPGHTEILQSMTDARSVSMLLTSEKISCSLVTTHIPLSEVPSTLTSKRILEVIGQTEAAMRAIQSKDSIRIAVLGLNPHSGENGLFGSEESSIIQPAIDKARAMGLDVVGPLPPDTAFIEDHLNQFDAFVCMYHDQGLIPLKLLSFDSAVNITLGLPIVRTSVDHGTALSIAGKGLANASSLYEAIALARSLSLSLSVSQSEKKS